MPPAPRNRAKMPPFRPFGGVCAPPRLVYTEQAVYLDGHDDAGAREHGTRALFDNLEASLKKPT